MAERGSCFTRGLFFTAQPGAWRGSCSTRGLFFNLFFLVLSVTRPSPPLGQVLVGTLNHATCNVYSPKAFETLIHENVTHILFSLLCLKYIFFSFYRSVRFKAKELVRTCKDYVIGREITTVLKIAVGRVSLELCDSRDYSASSLLVKKTE